MKCAFVADTFLLKKENDYYGITLTYEFLSKRYLNYVDELIVISREKDFESEKGNIDGYKISNGERITVSPVKNYKEIPDVILKKRIIEKELRKKLCQCDTAIIRLPNVLGLLACNICIELKIPYIIEMLACPWDGYLNHANNIGKFIAPFMYHFNRRVIKKSNDTIYVTKDFLQKRYPTNGKAYSCSDVELKEFDEEVIKNKIKNYNNIDTKKMTFATTANIEMKYKGHIYVFKAMSLLKKNGYEPIYYLIGNGNNKRLKKISKKLNIDDNIVFVGSLNHDDVFKKLDSIDVYIQPSLQEGLPRALVEAMSRGCVCIGSNAGGIPELLEKTFIFKKRKYKELYRIITSLDNNIMVKSANYNYQTSKEYGRDILEKKRDTIYTVFFDSFR